MGKKRATPAANTATLYTCICCEGAGKVPVLGICPLCDGIGYFEDSDPVVEAPKVPGKAAKARAKDISQTLSMLLRHQARERGISIDRQGWVLLQDALDFANDTTTGEEQWEGGPVTLDEIDAVVRESEKKRFQIWSGDPPMIRAVQGHSIEGVDADLDPVDLKEIPVAVHGTYYDAWDAIKADGLNKMSRNQVHLARDLPGESGIVSGMRSSCQVLIWVDLVKAAAAGIKFMQSANGVVLSEGIDGRIGPQFFHKVVDRKTSASLL